MTTTSPANLTTGQTIRFGEISEQGYVLLGKRISIGTVASVEQVGGQSGHWTTYQVTFTDGRVVTFSNKQRVEVTALGPAPECLVCIGTGLAADGVSECPSCNGWGEI